MKDFGRGVVLSFLSLVFFGALAEGTLRLIGFQPERGVTPLFSWSERGEYWRMRPGARWKTRVGGHPVAINAYGLRDRKISARAVGAPRILVLGDSVTFGHGVANHATFVRRLERLLQQDHPKLEIINGGSPGWSSRQQLIFYRDFGRRLEPDVVLVAFVLNDFTEMHRGTAEIRARQSGQIAKGITWLAERSSLISAMKLVYGSVVDPHNREISAITDLAYRSESPEVQHAMDVTVGELRELLEMARSDGARFGLVVFPFRFQFRSEGLDAPQRRLERFAMENQVPFLDTLPMLRKYGPDRVLLDADHLTPFGHGLVADALELWLRETSLISR